MFSGALATECEQKELWQYTGLCWLAAARCQGTLENVSSEINLLIKAGRQFLIAEKKNDDIGCPSIGYENIQVFLTYNINCSKIKDKNSKISFMHFRQL